MPHPFGFAQQFGMAHIPSASWQCRVGANDLLGKVFEYLTDYRFDLRDSVCYRLPQEIVIDSEVEVYQFVSHPGHLFPGDGSVLLGKLGTDPICLGAAMDRQPFTMTENGDYL